METQTLGPMELSRLSGAHPATIYQALQRGKLKAEKFLGRWLIPQDEAERFIQERKQRLESKP